MATEAYSTELFRKKSQKRQPSAYASHGSVGATACGSDFRRESSLSKPSVRENDFSRENRPLITADAAPTPKVTSNLDTLMQLLGNGDADSGVLQKLLAEDIRNALLCLSGRKATHLYRTNQGQLYRTTLTHAPLGR